MLAAPPSLGPQDQGISAKMLFGGYHVVGLMADQPWYKEVAWNGEGEPRAMLGSRAEGLGSRVGQADTAAAFPAPAKPATEAQIKEMLDRIEAAGAKESANPKSEPLVVALPDDWRTQGDWLGRYGRYWACLAAMNGPQDYLWGAGEQRIDYAVGVGPHCKNDDRIRRWVEWLYTDDRRCLELPPIYLHSRIIKKLTNWTKSRRQTNWDDHGEVYPNSQEGPDLYCMLQVPAGSFVLSLYGVNYNGQADTFDRMRDYRVSIRRHGDQKELVDSSDFETQPELAHTRIVQFCGGPWKRFLVRGPTTLCIQVNRSYSSNAILSGVMLDSLNEEPEPYFTTNGPPSYVNTPAAAHPEPSAALIDRLATVRERDPLAWTNLSRPGCVALLRRLAAGSSSSGTSQLPPLTLGASCHYQICDFVPWERSQQARGFRTARAVERALRWDQTSLDNSGKGRQAVESFFKRSDTNSDY